ncbi:hypothetical protein GOFOIKOB_5237 [Methylobacterium tardum]|uniref:CHASE3 domain-containing protein n=1 Tax=Methylobacterium tardum TaxID=374432 RepID=A0AA37TIU8_9HYPH|nr:hypothetical protein GOFOIKOB_5237 [Methylobacterium tardum]GLS71734.1 hypothetical protein GCM10007890_37470 [Methylobacterium tardum]
MPNTLGLNRTIGGAIGIIALVSLLSSGAVLLTGNERREATDALERSNQVIRGLESFRAAMLNQEIGLRGYLITGRESSLEPYRDGRPALDEAISRLRSVIGNGPERTRLLNEAESAARDWQTNIGEAAIRLAADPATRRDGVRIEVEGRGKQFFDTLRARLSGIESLVESARARRNAEVARAERRESMALWGGTLITLLICLAIGIAIRRLIVQPLVA